MALTLSVGAQVCIVQEQFEQAVADCDRAIQINPGFVKAYSRKALALLQMPHKAYSDKMAIDCLKQGLDIAIKTNPNDPIVKEMEKLLISATQEHQMDNLLAVDHPERARFERLIAWMRAGGAQFNKMKLRYYSADYRGVHAARDIVEGETILYVPHD